MPVQREEASTVMLVDDHAAFRQSASVLLALEACGWLLRVEVRELG